MIPTAARFDNQDSGRVICFYYVSEASSCLFGFVGMGLIVWVCLDGIDSLGIILVCLGWCRHSNIS